MKSHRRALLQFLFIALCVSALVLAFAPAAQVQQSAQVSTTTRGGLQTVTFDTLEGRVLVNLPDDMTAGDTISGTVVAQPKGTNEAERSTNLAELEGYVVEIKPRVVQAGATDEAWEILVARGTGDYTVFTHQLRPGSPGNTSGQGLVDVSLEQPKQGGSSPPGKVMAVTAIPYNDFQGRMGHARPDNIASPLVVVAENSNFVLPKIAQQGRPVEIPGPFDGSFENTKVTIGGEEVPILAESPRKAVFQSPIDTTGPAEIVVSEGKTETKGEYRNVKVKLSAPKTKLIKGESTTLKIEVSGLQRIKEPVPLHLVKGGVVTMQGGDVQTMSIKPAEVEGNGAFSTTRTITGGEAGVWNATATVVIFDVCLHDDNNGNSLIFSSGTGDYIFCQGRSAPAGQNPIALSSFDFGGDFRGGVMVSSGLLDGAGSAPGTISIGPGASLAKNGSFTLADFNFTAGHIHAQIDDFTHSGTATVQTTTPKQTFTITDRDTRNNTCTCK